MRKSARILSWLMLSAVIFSCGCSQQAVLPHDEFTPEPTLPNGMVVGEIGTAVLNDGLLDRHYLYYIPTSYRQGTPMPVMMVLHGSGSNALWQLHESKFHELAEQEGFIVIAPNAVAIHPDGSISSEGKSSYELGTTADQVRWNVFPGLDPQDAKGVDDTAYLGALFDLFFTDLSIDRSHVFVCGLSHGAFMSIKLALAFPEKITGFASVAGLLSHWLEDETPGANLKAVFINGDADVIVPVTGMYYPQLGIPVYALSLEDTIAWFMGKWGKSNPNPIVTILPQIVDPSIDPTQIIRTHFDQQIVQYIVHEGGHNWPGGSAPISGKLSRQASATQIIWEELIGTKPGTT